jgi:hypothetical protein
LIAYLKSLELLKKRNAIIPASLLNNIGVLHHLKQDTPQAQKYIDVSIRVADEQTDSITDLLKYNKARMAEPSAESKSLYEELAESGKFPEGEIDAQNVSYYTC